MPQDQQHVGETARVQITPADPNAAPAAETPAPQEEPAPVSKPSLLKRLGGLLGALMLVATVACTPSVSNPTQESAGMADSASVLQHSGIPFFRVSDDTHPAPTWHAHVRVDKRLGDDPGAPLYEVVEGDHNLLMTAGATQLWNCLSGGTCTTTLSTTNTMLAVGDGSTAPAAGNTDLAAAAGSNIATSGLSACTNATPIVCTNGSGSWSSTPAAGTVLVIASVNGNTAANGTFEVSSSTSTTVTLLNSAGNGSFTTSGSATVTPINKYRQQANAAGSAVVSTNQITYVATFGTTNANFAWSEWGVTTGAAATNKQATPPPLLLNRATPGGGLGTKTSAASWTLTVTLSLS